MLKRVSRDLDLFELLGAALQLHIHHGGLRVGYFYLKDRFRGIADTGDLDIIEAWYKVLDLIFALFIGLCAGGSTLYSDGGEINRCVSTGS